MQAPGCHRHVSELGRGCGRPAPVQVGTRCLCRGRRAAKAGGQLGSAPQQEDLVAGAIRGILRDLEGFTPQ